MDHKFVIHEQSLIGGKNHEQIQKRTYRLESPKKGICSSEMLVKYRYDLYALNTDTFTIESKKL